MNKRKSRPLPKRLAIDIGGFGLVALGLLTGWLPGPGGIPLILAGLGILSLNYEWAENLLKDFNKKRQEYTDKYLMTSPAVSITMDVLAVAFLVAATYGAYAFDQLWQRGICFGLALLAFTILLSNQKRFERIIRLFKK